MAEHTPVDSNEGAEQLKRIRAERELSQELVGTRVEVKQPTVARWEAAIWKPDARRRGLLMELFGIPWTAWDRPTARRHAA